MSNYTQALARTIEQLKVREFIHDDANMHYSLNPLKAKQNIGVNVIEEQKYRNN